MLDLAEEAVILASEAVNLSHRSEARPLLLLGQSFMHKSIVKASAPLWTMPSTEREPSGTPGGVAADAKARLESALKSKADTVRWEEEH